MDQEKKETLAWNLKRVEGMTHNELQDLEETKKRVRLFSAAFTNEIMPKLEDFASISLDYVLALILGFFFMGGFWLSKAIFEPLIGAESNYLTHWLPFFEEKTLIVVFGYLLINLVTDLLRKIIIKVYGILAVIKHRGETDE